VTHVYLSRFLSVLSICCPERRSAAPAAPFPRPSALHFPFSARAVFPAFCLAFSFQRPRRGICRAVSPAFRLTFPFQRPRRGRGADAAS